MFKRPGVIIFVGISLIVTIAFVIAFFTLPAYRTVILGVFSILVGGLQVTVGIIQILRAKAREEQFAWSKQPFFFFGLGYVCFGALFITIQFIDNVIAGIVGLLLLLLTLGLFFYAILLWSQQLARPNNLNNR